MVKKTIYGTLEENGHWIMFDYNGQTYFYDPKADVFHLKTENTPEIEDTELVAELYDCLEDED